MRRNKANILESLENCNNQLSLLGSNEENNSELDETNTEIITENSSCFEIIQSNIEEKKKKKYPAFSNESSEFVAIASKKHKNGGEESSKWELIKQSLVVKFGITYREIPYRTLSRGI